METCENGTLHTEDRSGASGGTDQPGESQSISNHLDAVCFMVYVHNNLPMFSLDEVQIERLEKANKQTQYFGVDFHPTYTCISPTIQRCGLLESRKFEPGCLSSLVL